MPNSRLIRDIVGWWMGTVSWLLAFRAGGDLEPKSPPTWQA